MEIKIIFFLGPDRFQCSGGDANQLFIFIMFIWPYFIVVMVFMLLFCFVVFMLLHC